MIISSQTKTKIIMNVFETRIAFKESPGTTVSDRDSENLTYIFTASRITSGDVLK